MNQIKELLRDNEMDSITINFILNKIENQIEKSSNESNCILCKNEKLNLCGYCFSNLVLKTLRELNLPEELIEYVKDYNNYDREEFLEEFFLRYKLKFLENLEENE